MPGRDQSGTPRTYGHVPYGGLRYNCMINYVFGVLGNNGPFEGVQASSVSLGGTFTFFQDIVRSIRSEISMAKKL
ncbi:hypothetical protein V6N12_070317 [Hibiscus sabdariffa]|uniref:Uncharacterized protein n=1 Tax=Hibiscus sabdariffa TaxID=183260 RepID=A0ABR2FH30_9ROSI